MRHGRVGTGSAFFLLFILLLLLLVLPNPSWARGGSLWVSGGQFVPFEGNSGASVVGEISFPTGSNFQIGVELKYKEFETEILDVKDVEVNSYLLSGKFRYYLSPEGISPYLGAGIGFSVNSIDTDKIEMESPTILVLNEIGVGFQAFGLLGALFPLGESVSLFGEVQIGLGVQLVDQQGGSNDGLDVENFGGLLGVGGIQFRF